MVASLLFHVFFVFLRFFFVFQIFYSKLQFYEGFGPPGRAFSPQAGRIKHCKNFGAMRPNLYCKIQYNRNFASKNDKIVPKKFAENRIPIQHVPLVPLWDRLGTHFGPIKPTMVPFRGSSGTTLGVSGHSLAASGVHFRALRPSEDPCYASTRARRNARSD